MPDETGKPIVLLVEDEEDDVFFFKRTLGKCNHAFSLHHACNGSAAIEFLSKISDPAALPQIVFLDLKMPVVNGFDVLRWMQKQSFPRRIPVVVLSGSEEQNDKDTARQLGAAGYLVKPLAVADLSPLLQDADPNGPGFSLKNGESA